MDSDAFKTTQPVTRRERNKQKVKERLYSSALLLFSQKGYDHTSVDEIAEHADVARGTFFNYFQRKEDLIDAWADNRRERLMAHLEENRPSRGSGSIARLEQCMCVLGRLNEDEPDLTSAMLTAWVKAGRPLIEEPYVGEIFAKIVEAGRESGDIVADVSSGCVGNVLRDLYLGALYRWSQHRNSSEHKSLDQELQAILQLLVRGIANSPANTPGSPVVT